MSKRRSSRLSRRRFFQGRYEDLLDDLGFLPADPGQLKDALRVEDLLEHRATLVLAQPWFGKSRVLKDTGAALEQDVDGKLGFAAVHFTDLTVEREPGQCLPGWWTGASSPAGRKAWLVDGLDEGEAAQPAIGRQLLHELESRGAHEEADVRILVTCRDSEVPPRFVEDFQRLFPDLQVVRLGPVDSAEAAEICGGEDKFRAAGRVIRDHDLREICGLPPILKTIARLVERNEIPRGTAGVWRALLQGLLDAPWRDRSYKANTHVTERFKYCRRRAVLHTFTSEQEIDLEGARALEMDRPLEVAREAILSGVFRRTATATGHRFDSRHVQEWLTAFELDEIAARGGGAQVRALLTGGGERVPLPFATLLRLASSMEHLAGDDWLQSELLAHDTELLDGLQAAVRTAAKPLSIVYSDRFPRPRARAFTRLLQQRLVAPGLSEAEQELLFELVSAEPTEELLPLALQFACDPARPRAVRLDANRVIEKLGGDAQLERLEEAARSGAETDEYVRSHLIRTLIHRKKWSAGMVLRKAPAPHPTHWDQRVILLEDAVARATTAELVSIFGEAGPGEFQWRSGPHARHLTASALERLAGATDLDARCASTFIAWLSAHSNGEHFDDTEQVIGSQPLLRTEILQLGLRGEIDRDTISLVVDGLTKEDARWLVGAAGDRSRAPDWLYPLLLGVSRRLALRDVEELVQRESPETISRAAAAEQDMERRRQERAAKRKPEAPKDSLAARVDAVLQDPTKDALTRLRELSWLCFARWPRAPGVTGSFEDLPEEQRLRVLEACKADLERATPTKVVPSRRFTSGIVYEGAAFQAVVRHAGSDWLTADLVERWLPAHLQAIHEDPEIEKWSADAQPSATAEIFARFIREELGSGAEHQMSARRAPASLWTNGLLNFVEPWLSDEEIPGTARADLLRVIASRQPAEGLELARRLRSPPLASAGAQVLVALSPEEGIPALLELVKARGVSELRDAARLFDEVGLLRASPERWPDALTADVALCLYQHPLQYPPEKEAGEAYVLTDDVHLLELRSRLVDQLSRSKSPAARSGMKAIAAVDPEVDEWMKHVHANAAVHLAFKRTRASSEDRPVIELQQLEKLLEDSRYRLTRNNAELQRVVVETFRSFEESLPFDFSQLRDGRGRVRREPVFQSYLRRRLDDHLPGKLVERESWVPFDNRSDYAVIVGKDTDRQGYRRVPVEVKWSSNRDVYRGVAAQLGEKYLKAPHLSHGVYVVGWTGKAPSHRGKPVTTPEDCLRALKEERDDFQEKNPDLHIEIVLLRCDARPRRQRKRVRPPRRTGGRCRTSPRRPARPAPRSGRRRATAASRRGMPPGRPPPPAPRTPGRR